MTDEIDKIEEELKTADNPITLAAFLTRLAAWNSYRTNQLKKIVLIKPKIWLGMKRYLNVIESDEWKGVGLRRDKELSDKHTDMIWDTTENGQAEIALIYELKRIDILYRSISKRLSAIENDYRMSKSQI
jgi:hypothetical protein